MRKKAQFKTAELLALTLFINLSLCAQQTRDAQFLELLFRTDTSVYTIDTSMKENGWQPAIKKEAVTCLERLCFIRGTNQLIKTTCPGDKQTLLTYTLKVSDANNKDLILTFSDGSYYLAGMVKRKGINLLSLTRSHSNIIHKEYYRYGR